jgi:hypothetical protein
MNYKEYQRRQQYLEYQAAQSSGPSEEERQAQIQADTDEMMGTASYTGGEGFRESAQDFVGNAAIATGRGMSNMVDNVKDGYYRATGNEDALSALNSRREKEDALYEKFHNEQKAISTVGQIVGETAAIAPVGLLARGGLLAARGGAALTRNASFGVAAGEGLATGVVGTRGDMEDRLKGGIIEAGLGGTMQAVGDGVGGYFRQARQGKTAMADGVVAEEARIAKQSALVEEEGGYTQDVADMTGSQTAIDYRDNARGAGDRSTLEFEAKQEADIQAKAEGFASENGGFRRTDIEQGEGVQKALTDLRDGDLKQVDEAYDLWRASHGSNTKVDTGEFFNTLDSVKLNSKQKEFKKTIDKVLEENGVKPGKPMSIDQVENIIIDINSHWDSATPQFNQAAGAYKEALDKYVIDGFGDITNLPANHPVRLGKEARVKAKAMNDAWNRGDILDKITKIPKGSTEHSLRALDGIRALKAKGNYKDLRKVKLMLNQTAEGRQVWKDIEASEIFEALEKAMPSIKARKKADGLQDVVDGKAFNTRINKMDTESQEVLFGKDKAAKMQKAAERWSERGRTTSTRGQANVSGTARAALQGAVRLMASRGAGGDVLATVPFIGQFFQRRNARKISEAAQMGQSGKLSAEGKIELENELIEEFKKNLSPAIIDRHSGIINNLIRSYVRGDNDDTVESDAVGKTQP